MEKKKKEKLSVRQWWCGKRRFCFFERKILPGMESYLSKILADFKGKAIFL